MKGLEIGDIEHAFGKRRAALAGELSKVTFGISAVAADKALQKLPGSGVFIAPYIGLTAKHVIKDAATLHAGAPNPTGQIAVSLKLSQASSFDMVQFTSTEGPSWTVVEVVDCPYSDLALLCVLPANDAAEEAAKRRWNDGFLRVRLLPPKENDLARAFGFPGLDWSFDPETNLLVASASIALSEGRVTEVFGDWRTPPSPPPPAILGPKLNNDQRLTDFPCFETTAPVDPGMSGGPVFHNGELLGVVSTGLDLGGATGDDETQSRVATLWPLMYTQNIPAGGKKLSFRDLVRSAMIDCPDWREVEHRAYLDERDGKKYARMK